MDLKAVSEFARIAHENANNKYDGGSYYVHVEMVENGMDRYETVFKANRDYRIARAGASCHDLIEDAGMNFNDIAKATSKSVARIALDVTDVHEENRLLRHLFTMGKTMKNYRAIIVKMADMRANALYSKTHGSSMYSVYVEEYKYRRPIFKKALKWYTEYLDAEVLSEFWKELDEIHGYKKVV